jgi:alkylation response protein AidB-like acyl-CoA dehydrogenase
MAYETRELRHPGERLEAAVATPALLPAEPPRPAAAREPERPTAATRESELRTVVAALDEAVAKRDLSIFYRTFRASSLVNLPLEHGANPRGLHRACFDVLRRLGSSSPAVGVAIFNHYSVVCTLATFPLRGQRALAMRRRALLRSIRRGRQLVANTTTRIHADKVNSFGGLARREGEAYRLTGKAAYMSLAGEGDIVLFMSEISGEGHAIFLATLRDNPQIQVGPFVFPNAMVDSDTRSVAFDCLVQPRDMLWVDRNIAAFQVAWHQVLYSAPFLGAAGRALEEVRKFLRAVLGGDGKPLAELDGMIVDIGRMGIEYRSACAISYQAGQALEALAHRATDAAAMADAMQLACAAKHVGTRCAEEIVGQARRIIGGRSFAGGHPMERLSHEVVFGPLGGELNALIERRYGRQLLGDSEVLSQPW